MRRTAAARDRQNSGSSLQRTVSLRPGCTGVGTARARRVPGTWSMTLSSRIPRPMADCGRCKRCYCRDICNIQWSQAVRNQACWLLGQAANRDSSPPGKKGRGCNFGGLVMKGSWARSGRYRRPSRVLAGAGCLGAGPLQLRVSGRLAGARPGAACCGVRVAAAHCDGRERRALLTPPNSNDKHPSNAPVLHHSVISSGSASAVQHTPSKEGRCLAQARYSACRAVCTRACRRGCQQV